MPVRQGTATWQGGRKGDGTVAVESGAFEGSYSFPSRFEDGTGTNPEELIGAAHAGCYTMSLVSVLEDAGHDVEEIDTTADVHIERGDDGYVITLIELTSEASVPGVDDDEFQEYAQQAEEGCPVSNALAATEITLDARLAG